MAKEISSSEHEVMCDTMIANFIESKRLSFGYDLDYLSKLSGIPKLRLFELERNIAFISIKPLECVVLESIYKLDKGLLSRMAMGEIELPRNASTQ